MSFDVHVEVTAPIATVRLVQAAPREAALDLAGWRALGSAFHGLCARRDVACVAVLGVGGGPAADRGGALETMDGALLAIQRCTHPTVAIVEGLCSGPGLEVAASCDLRVCSESSRFGRPIERLGGRATSLADWPAPLVRLLGASSVLATLRAGELIGAPDARRAGLVNRVLPDATVVERGYGLVARIAAGAPLVNRWHKRSMRRLLASDG